MPINPIDNEPAATNAPKTIRQRFNSDPDLLRSLPSISASLKAPQLPNVNAGAITLEQVESGVTVLIPGSAQLRSEDIIVFYWGTHECYTPLHQSAVNQEVVWLLCLAYPLIDQPQYGAVDLFYEVYRAEQLIGISPVVPVVIETPTDLQR